MTPLQVQPRVWDMSKQYQYLIEMLRHQYGDNLWCKVTGKGGDFDLHHITPRSKVKIVFIHESGILIHRNSWRNLIPLSHEAHLYKVHAHPEWARQQGLLK